MTEVNACQTLQYLSCGLQWKQQYLLSPRVPWWLWWRFMVCRFFSLYRIQIDFLKYTTCVLLEGCVYVCVFLKWDIYEVYTVRNEWWWSTYPFWYITSGFYAIFIMQVLFIFFSFFFKLKVQWMPNYRQDLLLFSSSSSSACSSKAL